MFYLSKRNLLRITSPGSLSFRDGYIGQHRPVSYESINFDDTLISPCKKAHSHSFEVATTMVPIGAVQLVSPNAADKRIGIDGALGTFLKHPIN